MLIASISLLTMQVKFSWKWILQTAKPSGDYNPSWHLHCNFVWDFEPAMPNMKLLSYSWPIEIVWVGNCLLIHATQFGGNLLHSKQIHWHSFFLYPEQIIPIDHETLAPLSFVTLQGLHFTRQPPAEKIKCICQHVLGDQLELITIQVNILESTLLLLIVNEDWL